MQLPISESDGKLTGTVPFPGQTLNFKVQTEDDDRDEIYMCGPAFDPQAHLADGFKTASDGQLSEFL